MRLIDLSTELRDGMPKPPSGPRVDMKYVLTHSAEEEARRGFTNKMEQFTITTHVATHIDAPAHFTMKGKNIDDYPLEFFYMVPTVLLDLEREPYGIIDEQDIKDAERACGEIQEGDLVIINTGSYKRYEDPDYEKSPYLTREAARYLADKKVKMVGIDSFTVDDPRVKDKPAHVELLCKNGIPVIECVVNLGELPMHRFKTICMPLKVKEGSGGFTRMAAVIE
ncbi:MAG: cyclase family protein [Oscillospiraceae bacterium]